MPMPFKQPGSTKTCGCCIGVGAAVVVGTGPPLQHLAVHMSTIIMVLLWDVPLDDCALAMICNSPCSWKTASWMHLKIAGFSSIREVGYMCLIREPPVRNGAMRY